MTVSADNIGYRVDALEKQVQALQAQFANYVPAKENELRLNIILDTVGRIERKQVDLENKVDSKLTDLDSKLTAQKVETLNQSSQQQRRQDQLQIRWLRAIVGALLSLISLALAGYFTHIFG